jgi:hypothetical protein
MQACGNFGRIFGGVFAVFLSVKMSDPVSVLGKYLKDVISKAIAENDLELLRKIKGTLLHNFNEYLFFFQLSLMITKIPMLMSQYRRTRRPSKFSENIRIYSNIFRDEQDDEENNHYVYVFLSSDDKILRVGRSKVSKKIRELHTIRESLKDEPKEEVMFESF